MSVEIGIKISVERSVEMSIEMLWKTRSSFLNNVTALAENGRTWWQNFAVT